MIGKIQASFIPARFSSEHTKKNIAYIFSFGCLLFCIAILCFVICTLKTEDRVFVVDDSSTISIGLLQTLKNNTEIYHRVALVAAQCVFQISPVGLDLPEIAKSMLSEPAFKKLQEYVKESEQSFQSGNIHQKPEIESIETITEKKNRRIVRVTGNLVQAGLIDGHSIAETKPFNMILAFMINPNLTERGQYPFLIDDFAIQGNES